MHIRIYGLFNSNIYVLGCHSFIHRYPSII